MRAGRFGAGLALAASVTCLLAAPALAATPAKGSYSGRTTQKHAPHHAVELRVDRDHAVARFAIDWRARDCAKPDTHWDGGTTIRRPKNDPVGTFHDHGTYTSEAGNGFRGRITHTVDGHFTDGTHATGTWKATVKIFDASGDRINTCSVRTHWHVGP
jgi:hypothetical protein